MQKMNELQVLKKAGMQLTKKVMRTELYLTKEGLNILLKIQLAEDIEELEPEEIQEFENLLFDYKNLYDIYIRYRRENTKTN